MNCDGRKKMLDTEVDSVNDERAHPNSFINIIMQENTLRKKYGYMFNSTIYHSNLIIFRRFYTRQEAKL